MDYGPNKYPVLNSNKIRSRWGRGPRMKGPRIVSQGRMGQGLEGKRGLQRFAEETQKLCFVVITKICRFRV